MRRPYMSGHSLTPDRFSSMCTDRILVRCLVQDIQYPGTTLSAVTTSITIITKVKDEDHPGDRLYLRVRYIDRYSERYPGDRRIGPLGIDKICPPLNDSKPIQEILAGWQEVSEYWLGIDQVVTCEQIEDGPVTFVAPAVGLRILEHLSRIETLVYAEQVFAGLVIDETLSRRLTGFIEHYNKQWEHLVGV